MDYEIAYKEVLNRATTAYKDEDKHLKATLERIFPELKEEVDELTWLTNYISEEAYSLSMDIRDDIDRIKLKKLQKSLAWLEKMGEHLKFCKTIQIGDSVTRNEDGVLVNMSQLDRIAKPRKKQVEQRLIEKYGITGIKSKHAEGKLGEMIKKTESADKIEPKFKVGEWIIQENIGVYEVTEICESWYEVIDAENKHYSIGFDKEYMCRLWTINDAKYGDVLCYKDEISLYKHDIKNYTKEETTFGGFVYHCCYDGKRFIMDSFYSLTEQDKMDIHPATKEQRDLLFQKMKDAGYEWDDKEKGLKKI